MMLGWVGTRIHRIIKANNPSPANSSTAPTRSIPRGPMDSREGAVTAAKAEGGSGAA
jgi:hypothetical protein